MVREWMHCCGEAANHQLPIAAAFWIIQIVSTEECSSLLQNLMQSCCSTHSVILNATATQYTCSLNGVYHTHWLVKSSLFMHVHSSPFSLAARLHQCHHTGCSHYINKGWTFSGQTSMHCTTCFSFWSRAAYCMSGMLCERQRKVWLSVSKKFAI